MAACESAPALPAMSKVTLSEHFLTWDAVDNALYYSVRVTYGHNGYEIPVKDTTYSLSLFEEGTYALQVRARLQTGFTAYSPVITYTLQEDVPTTPTKDEDIVLRGSGTFEDPIRIYTKQELAIIPAENRKVVEDGVTKEYVNYFRLEKDIDLTDEEWVSIGTSSKPFEGVFDGNGHTISHLTQTKYNDDTYRYGGLFGNTSSAVIYDLNLTDVDIRLGVSTKGFNVGGLIGESKLTIVQNCSVSGNIAIDSPQSTTQQGAVGMLIGTSWGTELDRCTTQGTVDVTFARVYAGGMMGLSRNTRHEYIRNCLSRVSVHSYGTGVESTTDKSPHGTSFACGFGYISNTSGIENCVWLGTAEAETIMGTATVNYGAGMFANTSKVTSTSKVSNIKFVDCYFDAAALGDLVDRTTYKTLAEVADRYLVAGAESQQRVTTAFCVDETNRDDQASYEQLDFDTIWTIREGKLALQNTPSTWCTVTYMVGDEVYAANHVLTNHESPNPEGDDIEGFVRWETKPNGEKTAITDCVQQDIVVRAVLNPIEE